jgi:hypothetical protein
VVALLSRAASDGTMTTDLVRTKLELEKRNAALEEELAALNHMAASGSTDAPTSLDLETWAICTPTELALLKTIADAVGARDAAEMARLRDELQTRIANARAREDVYIELCQDLIAEAQRLRELCRHVEAERTAAAVP